MIAEPGPAGVLPLAEQRGYPSEIRPHGSAVGIIPLPLWGASRSHPHDRRVSLNSSVQSALPSTNAQVPATERPEIREPACFPRRQGRPRGGLRTGRRPRTGRGNRAAGRARGGPDRVGPARRYAPSAAVLRAWRPDLAPRLPHVPSYDYLAPASVPPRARTRGTDHRDGGRLSRWEGAVGARWGGHEHAGRAFPGPSWTTGAAPGSARSSRSPPNAGPGPPARCAAAGLRSRSPPSPR